MWNSILSTHISHTTKIQLISFYCLLFTKAIPAPAPFIPNPLFVSYCIVLPYFGIFCDFDLYDFIVIFLFRILFCFLLMFRTIQTAYHTCQHATQRPKQGALSAPRQKLVVRWKRRGEGVPHSAHTHNPLKLMFTIRGDVVTGLRPPHPTLIRPSFFVIHQSKRSVEYPYIQCTLTPTELGDIGKNARATVKRIEDIDTAILNLFFWYSHS